MAKDEVKDGVGIIPEWAHVKNIIKFAKKFSCL